jgi:hypothetical protein
MSGVLLHVGFQKTGTTSIQYWLRDHSALLAEHGFRFPRGWLHLNTHVELSLCLTRPDRMTQGRLRGDEWRDETWRRFVLWQIIEDLNSHVRGMTILSNEDLSLFRHEDEFEALRRVIGDAAIIMYLRRPDDFLASLRAHYAKDSMAGPSSDPDAFNYTEPGSWVARYEDRVEMWRRYFTRVRVLDYDVQVQRDGSVIPSFLRLIGVPVPADALAYRLQRRNDPVPRLRGNRWANGLGFGESPSSAEVPVPPRSLQTAPGS